MIFIVFDYHQSGLMVSSTMWIALITKDHKDSCDVRVRPSHQNDCDNRKTYNNQYVVQ